MEIMDHPILKVGNKVFIRTVTFHFTGRVKEVTPATVLLSDAAWIAESGRWADTLSKGDLREVEPYPGEVAVERGAIVDSCLWSHDLPRDQR